MRPMPAVLAAVNHIPHGDRLKGSGLYREGPSNPRVQVHGQAL